MRSGGWYILRAGTVFAGTAILFSVALFGQEVPAPKSPAAVEASVTSSPAMEPLLRARKNVEKYFQQAANVVCTENVTQATIGKNGKADYRED